MSEKNVPANLEQANPTPSPVGVPRPAAAPPGTPMRDVYRGVRPFLLVQAIVLAIVFMLPRVVQWLPEKWG